MRKFLVLFILVFASVGIFNSTQAQNTPLPQEAIVSYSSNIVVNTDNSIDVTEVITYNTGLQEHHGIYRDIYPYSSQERKMSIENISVLDELGNIYQFEIFNSGKNIRIKIGDPNRTFLGQKTYIIKYHATKALGQFKDFDEIYWNVTGNEWGMPINQARATVVLPVGASARQSACYYGMKDSKTQCPSANYENGIYTFTSANSLNAHEGLTIAIGFPKGIVIPYTPKDDALNFFEKYWSWLFAIFLPVLTLFFSLRNWYKKGRDPKGTGVIVAQYDIIDNLTPMEVIGITNEKVNTKSISAEIIYFATKGYLKINQLENSFIGLIKSTDYELIKLKDFSDLPNDFDQKLLNNLFSEKQSVKLSSLRNVFYKDAATVIRAVLNALLNKGYYKNLGSMENAGGRIAIILFMSVWASLFFGGIFGAFILRGNPLPFIVGIFISIIIYGIFSYLSPAKTEKGVLTKEYLLGLKDYLQIAEKDRLQFHNAPEKKPEIFEKLLPYAMVLGVANIWAKEFEGIYTVPPSWYSGPSSTAFSAAHFAQDMGNFSSFASSSLSSSPSSSGSGGGGSSGGGGGGGGGGSW